jgi:dienelactone hydrolase
MPKRFALATLALCVVALGATPARPPDGTYTYIVSNVPSVTQTTIVIRTTGSTVSTLETLVANGATISTQTDYDVQTLLPMHYRVTTPSKTQQVSLMNGTATVVGTTVSASKLPGTVGPLISDGLFSAMTMLPSIVAAAGRQPISDVTQTFAVIQMTTTSASDPRPAGVPLTDIETGLTYAGQYQTFWSNPTTHTVDRTDIGGASIALSNYASATAVQTPTPAPTPYPTVKPRFSSRDVSFASSGGAIIAGTLTVPDSLKPHRMPALIFIHGSGAETRDGGVPENPTFLDLSNALSNSGIIVLRYDKRATGKSTGAPTEDWHLLGGDARAAIAFLKRQPSVDQHRIFILGHSEGGAIAPLIAPGIQGLAGIIMMAAPAIPMEQIIAEQAGDNNPKAHTNLPYGLNSYVGLDPAVYITKVNVPILVLQGGSDFQVLARDLPHLVNAARDAHRNITVKLLPNDDHLFLRLSPGATSTLAEYFVPAPLDPRVPQAISTWIRSLSTR